VINLLLNSVTACQFCAAIVKLIAAEGDTVVRFLVNPNLFYAGRRYCNCF
jgi:hypothetical protein